MKIKFLFSFLKLLTETADQSEFLSTHLFLIEDLYKVNHFLLLLEISGSERK